MVKLRKKFPLPKLLGLLVLVIFLPLFIWGINNNNTFDITGKAAGKGNIAPIITPKKLPRGKVGKNYTATITVSDAINDNLTISHRNPPPGLNISECKENFRGVAIHTYNCQVYGIPSRSDNYSIFVKASDGKSTNSKFVKITILR